MYFNIHHDLTWHLLCLSVYDFNQIGHKWSKGIHTVVVLYTQRGHHLIASMP